MTIYFTEASEQNDKIIWRTITAKFTNVSTLDARWHIRLSSHFSPGSQFCSTHNYKNKYLECVVLLCDKFISKDVPSKFYYTVIRQTYCGVGLRLFVLSTKPVISASLVSYLFPIAIDEYRKRGVLLFVFVCTHSVWMDNKDIANPIALLRHLK